MPLTKETLTWNGIAMCDAAFSIPKKCVWMFVVCMWGWIFFQCFSSFRLFWCSVFKGMLHDSSCPIFSGFEIEESEEEEVEVVFLLSSMGSVAHSVAGLCTSQATPWGVA